MPESIAKKVLRVGDKGKSNPYTIAIVANPVIENGEYSGRFKADPINKQPARFAEAAEYVNECLFGKLDGQREKFLADPTIVNKIRVVSLLVTGLKASKDNSLIVDSDGLLIARRDYFNQFMMRYDIAADVVFAISGGRHDGASAWATDDDDEQGGVSFRLNDRSYVHRYYYKIPGTVAMHADNDSLTAIHEFGHAASSYSNGYLSDLYVDFHDEDVNKPIINKLYGRPIPGHFCTYNGSDFLSDPTRDGLKYESDWETYHCELIDPSVPAIMDSYPQAPNDREMECQHDRMTRQFLLERIRAKCSR